VATHAPATVLAALLALLALLAAEFTVGGSMGEAFVHRGSFAECLMTHQ
jgi:hypothetical protein